MVKRKITFIKEVVTEHSPPGNLCPCSGFILDCKRMLRSQKFYTVVLCMVLATQQAAVVTLNDRYFESLSK